MIAEVRRKPARTAALALLAFLPVATARAASTQAPPAARPGPVPPGASPSAANPDLNGPRPIDGVDTVFMDDMTWMEIRDAMRAGKDTVIVATGGLEQNGPYLTSAKHNVILRGTTEAIARKLGNALVASIIQFVPEGDIDPPSGHMRYPGTISLSAATYEALLTDVASSLKTNGFRTIVMIGDSGGNQAGMKKVAEALTAKWSAMGAATRAYFVPQYYEYAAIQKWLEETHGVKQVDEGLHDDYAITSIMAAVDPESVRFRQRVAKGKATINGVALEPLDRTQRIGRALIDYRAQRTIEGLKAQMAGAITR
jgi:creatinine amidohydrolase/Fe(II)-dependent formamide hydrolase-like protein